MADLKKREFNVLELTGNNFIRWASDVKLYLKGKSLLCTIIELNPTEKGKDIEKDPIKIEEDKAKAASILRHHLTDSLKHEYTNYEDPKLLWEELNERFGHNKSGLLPKAIDEWIPIGTMAFNETNMIERNVRHRGRGNYLIRGRGRGKYHEKSGMNTFEQGNFYGRGRGRGRGHGLSRGRGRSHKHKRCGMTEHWGRTCRTAKHLVDLYQASQKNKGKGAEANFVNEASTSGPTLDVSDFSEDVNLHKLDPQEEDNYIF
ncbi:uncharacterized protein LOC130828639 [Amaranthus tricolor]|uniref:uncharacterized protein LOC130828639 n=1 Tax=Amaranthus tricolor TaxID=29722 RepID=UPI00258EDF32|nr:uncharacterized protein LOC130828639 [Amaranthus tricolor]